MLRRMPTPFPGSDETLPFCILNLFRCTRAYSMDIQLKRAYEEAGAADGYRILVDRVWPRGVSKDKARIDWWPKEVAPSKELRQWFGHDPQRWEGFKESYFAELRQHEEEVGKLLEAARRQRMTLVYASKEERYNNAVALKEYLESLPAP